MRKSLAVLWGAQDSLAILFRNDDCKIPGKSKSKCRVVSVTMGTFINSKIMANFVDIKSNDQFFVEGKNTAPPIELID